MTEIILSEMKHYNVLRTSKTLKDNYVVLVMEDVKDALEPIRDFLDSNQDYAMVSIERGSLDIYNDAEYCNTPITEHELNDKTNFILEFYFQNLNKNDA